MTDLRADRPFVLLTQDDCPNCERLKRMLAGPLKGQFDDQIETVHRQRQPEGFDRWVSHYDLRSVPALIRLADGAQVRETGGLGEVKGFLSQPFKASQNS